jgi:hypothetical protein
MSEVLSSEFSEVYHRLKLVVVVGNAVNPKGFINSNFETMGKIDHILLGVFTRYGLKIEVQP